ncbi:TPA: hypothetical protein EYP66_25695 [Candidatus Poribacteria bacterium]|nr:hypothetical protein [Candidatus Poribacteria bacterium]
MKWKLHEKSLNLMRMKLVIKMSKNLGSKFLVSALLIILLITISPAQSLADMNDSVTDFGLIWTYAQTSWPTIHRDSRNSDFVPIVAPVLAEEKWTALDGAAVLTAVTIGPEGNLYVTTGKGIGYSNLHAFDQDGNYLWSSEPVDDIDDLDGVAVVSSAIVDVEGDVYISDYDQFWAFHPDGSVKWVAPIPANFVTAAFTMSNAMNGYVGGITRDGEVLILNSNDGSLAAPILNLPGGAGPLPPATPPGLWQDLIDPMVIDDLYAAFFGYKFEVTNTPAVNPVNNRIYIAAAGPTADEGAFYGIDFTPGSLTIAFETPIGSGSGTSPAISPDGSRVYAADGDGNMYAFDAYTGAISWIFPIGETIGSPSIGPEGIIYSMGDGLVHAIADYGISGELLWSKDFDSIASEYLPPYPPKDPKLYPTSMANSIISITPRYLYVVANLGYEIFLPVYEQYFFIPKITVMLIMDAVSSSVIAPPMELRDTCDGVITIASDGNIYITHGSTARSIAYYTMNPLLPDPLKVEKPIGGISALEPISFLDLAIAGIHWVQNLDAEALSYLDSGMLDEAYTQVRRGTVQLDASANSIGDAEERGEIDSQRAQQARLYVYKGRKLIDKAKNIIGRERKKTHDALLRLAQKLIENAEKQLELALSILQGSDAPPLTRTVPKEF